MENLKSRVHEAFNIQKAHRWKQSNTTVKERIQKLDLVLRWIYNNREQIQRTLLSDFKKPAAETDLTEIFTTISEIKHVKQHLQKWLRPHRVGRTRPMLATRSYIQYEARGVVLILAPWNYPFMLTIGPFISAFAAGNCSFLKPSEYSPHTSELIRKMIEELFSSNEAVVFEGGLEVAQELLKMPFDHIFFTGSTVVGRKVMQAAAEHNSTITLELGGKTPTIVDETCHIQDAARKIAWGKFANAGQTCISPDYILVQESVKTKFLEEMIRKIPEYYDAAHMSYIVTESHFDRLIGFLDDAREKGAEVIYGGSSDREHAYIEPTVIDHPHIQTKLMEEEIFGPLIPVLSFTAIEEIPDIINKRTKPLALYIFSRNKRNIKYILDHTSSGGVCVNDVLIHFIHVNLPFGGVNHSGFGSAHGFYGFKTFSHERAVLHSSYLNFLKILHPPYTEFKQKIIDLALKYF